jgi:cytosine deaminase
MADGSVASILIRDGKIANISPAIETNGAETQIVDLSGYVLTESFVEPHAHLDKAFLSERIPNPTGDLMGAIHGLDEARHTITVEDTYQRALRAVQLMSKNGVTRVRTHADVTQRNGLVSVEALTQLREDCAHFIDIQIAMLVTWPVTRSEGAPQRMLAEKAIEAGVDVVGGCPHLDADPLGATNFFVSLAHSSKLPLDLHTDENLRRDSRGLESLATAVIAKGMETPVTASHCVSLSIQDSKYQQSVAVRTADADVRVIVLPQTNLYLQSRDVSVASPRAIAPITVLRDAGVKVGAGADNLQDPFNPMGRADPLETASLLVLAAHQLTLPALHLVTTGAAQATGDDEHQMKVGNKANLVAVRASTIREEIAMGPPDRIVVYGGVVLSDESRNRK